jgi:hypothetical protein
MKSFRQMFVGLLFVAAAGLAGCGNLRADVGGVPTTGNGDLAQSGPSSSGDGGAGDSGDLATTPVTHAFTAGLQPSGALSFERTVK